MIGAAFEAALAAASHCTPGCSAKDLVHEAGKLRLYRYCATDGATPRSAAMPPLLIVYALVNRPYMMDLQPDRSLVRGLLQEGLDVYLIDWGYPDASDRFVTLTDYVDRLLGGCVDYILAQHRMSALNMLGVCQGGVLSLCYAALRQERVQNLVTMVTPVDFHTPADLLSKWVRNVDVEAWTGGGNLPGDALNQLFVALRPFRLGQQKYVELALGPWTPARLETFVRVERWIADSPDLAGAAFRQYVRWFYQENRFARRDLPIAGRTVDLRSLELPVLNLIGTQDHLVPRDASRALGTLIGSRDYTEQEFDLGHIGMYVSERAQNTVPPSIARWLEARSGVRGARRVTCKRRRSR